MNKTEREELNAFPYELDNAIIEKFGADTCPESTYSLFTDKHITVFEAKGALRKRIQDFIDGYIQGNIELRRRLDLLNA
jgi:hypothetical protein